ncbi:hypothetical protein ATO10_15310 [Actibacterium atlanticum]|uniref:UPF0301 protein ATO10_15310 n=1 Tax=Actibacterium atlanticum TaxID=1461693 RepID=A0A058ZGU0_9RHOB|nr:YqgE/AlgH family protein [Actibacterium atlanticum]KCV80803.1 hypothetical protein ATO10_15310 [Actibacterium atlanticum]
MSTTDMNLSGKFLIAMPGMGDPRFDKSVVFMCAHSEDGAMGLIINKPTPDLTFPDLLKQLKLQPGYGRDIRIHFGGPVEHGRGFVLHSAEYNARSDSTLEVDGQFGLTATQDILEDMAQGEGPRETLLALGYSGWGPGQLEGEIASNGWLTCDASAAIAFDTENETKWSRALKTMGVDPLMLSADAGHA